MNVKRQQEIWTARTHSYTARDVISMLRSPCRFQIEFTDYLNQVGNRLATNRRVVVCELGCELGVTTLLLSQALFVRHCLDLNAHALRLLSEAASQTGQEVHVHQADMFRTGFGDAVFDIVFNNGVLEHYSQAERRRALTECARIVRPGGRVIIGVPNHCSLPYAVAYHSRRLFGRWSFPPERRIRTLAAELSMVQSLRQTGIVFFDRSTMFELLPKARFTAPLFRILDRVFRFQPYLRVIECERQAD